MTDAGRFAERLRASAMAGGAALMLGACSAGHVVDDWQCPLAQGTVCTSVAAADPAAPETRVPGAHAPERTRGGTPPAAGNPLRHAGSGGGAPETAGDAGRRGCNAGCGPFAWLAGLFSGLAADGEHDTAVPDTAETAAREVMHAGRESGAAVASAPDAHVAAETADAETDRAVLPASEEAAAAARMDRETGPSGESLRAPEEIGRIWIAPWIDADGIYREGAWVRAVIAPAGWRLP